MYFSSIRNRSGYLLTVMAIIALFITIRFNYMLFHIISETYIIFVSFLIFIITLNAKNIIKNFFLLLGGTFLSVAILRQFHLMAYPGLTIFPGTDLDISIQLLITSRYLENVGIISAIVFCNRKVRSSLFFFSAAIISAILIIIIMVFNFFPVCVVNETTFTRFILFSDTILAVSKIWAVFLIFFRNIQITNNVRKLLAISFMISAFNSTCSLISVNLSHTVSFIYHILEIISFYFIYRALLFTGIRDPFNTLLINLKNNELELNNTRTDLKTKIQKRTADLDLLNRNLEQEIKKRKLKETELEKTEEQLRLLLKSSRISIAHFDKNLKPVPLLLNGNDPSLLQLNFYRLSLLPQWGHLEKLMRSAIENKKSIRDEIEFKMQKESMFFDIVIEPFFDNNTISGIFVIAMDITGKKEIESILKIKQQAIESIYTIATSFNYQKKSVCEKICQSIAVALEVPIVKIDNTSNDQMCGSCSYINEKFEYSDSTDNCSLCKIVFSAKAGCQISGNMKELYPDSKCLYNNNIKTYLGVPVFSSTGETNGIICVMDEKNRKFTDDQMRLLEIFARYISNEIEKEMYVKELVQSREMALLGQLTSGVAHEVRNPLNAIWAVTEALFLDIDGDESNLIYKEHIHTQVKRLSRLMQDLLELGKPHLRNDRFSFTSLCIETTKLWTQNNAGKNYTIHLDIDTEKNKFMILGDSIKMQQVLINLLDNASEHSPDGSTITVQITKNKSRYLLLSVRDEGSGIQSKLIDRIFEPFFTTRKGGTGLGLSIVKRIVENHNGTIFIENNDPPPGLAVNIQLPLSDDLNTDDGTSGKKDLCTQTNVSL